MWWLGSALYVAMGAVIDFILSEKKSWLLLMPVVFVLVSVFMYPRRLGYPFSLLIDVFAIVRLVYFYRTGTETLTRNRFLILAPGFYALALVLGLIL